MKKTSPRRTDILPRALGAVLLLFLVLAVILWFCGIYHLAFLPRPDSGNADTSGEDTAPEPTTPPADTSPYLAVGISANDLIGCEEAQPSASELSALLASFPVCADPTALDAAATFHSADSRLVRLAIDGLPQTRYTGTKEVRTVVKTVLDDKYRTEFAEEYNTQERQSVMLAGGWIITALFKKQRFRKKTSNGRFYASCRSATETTVPRRFMLKTAYTDTKPRAER